MRTASWFPATCGPADDDKAPRRVRDAAIRSDCIRIHAECIELRQRYVVVEQPNDKLLAVDRRNRRDARIDAPAVDHDGVPPILGQAPIGYV